MGEETTKNSILNLSGGLNLGSVNLVHVIDYKSTVRAAAMILLIWLAAATGLEIIKYFISR